MILERETNNTAYCLERSQSREEALGGAQQTPQVEETGWEFGDDMMATVCKAEYGREESCTEREPQRCAQSSTMINVRKLPKASKRTNQ